MERVGLAPVGVACQGCGAEPGGRRWWCEDCYEWRRKTQQGKLPYHGPPKPCPYCGGWLPAAAPKHMTCAERACRQRRAQEIRVPRPSPRPWTRWCHECGSAFMADRSNPGARFCSHACDMSNRTARRLPRRSCDECGAEFRPVATVWNARYCSKGCSWAVSQRRRSAWKRGSGMAKDYAFQEIAERDGWTCGLCGEPVDAALMRTSTAERMRPTIDHIVPVSRGGPDIRANVQLAHLSCNASKGNSILVGPLVG